MSGYYFSVEEAILADWLCRPRPAAARGIRIDHPGALRALQAVFPKAVRPRRRAAGAFGEHTLANAAGRIALAAVPQRLSVASEPPFLPPEAPQPASVLDEAPVPPRALFEVDWEPVRSPRFQPEAYTLCDLPGFGVRAVVATQESAEDYGYHEVAVGWFGGEEPEVEGAGRVIRAWWQRQAAATGRGRWDGVLATGLVTEPLAEGWADQVWGAWPEARGRAG
jgi:hypothetical protein